MKLTTALRNTRATDIITSAGANPKIKFYNGTESLAPAGTLLATLNITGALGTATGGVFSGGAVGYATQGTITTPALKNNTGTVLANESGITAFVYNPVTGELIIKLTGQTTNGSGVMTLNDASIVSGTQYRVVIILGSGAEGMDKLTAS